MSEPHVTPLVRQLAQRHGVDLAALAGTGVGGRITDNDVYAASARLAPKRYGTQTAATSGDDGPPQAKLIPAGSGYLKIAPSAAKVEAHRVQQLSAIPAFTASGLDPQALLSLPGPVRSAVAAAPTLAAASELAQRYRGLSDEDALAALSKDRTVSCEHGGLGTPASWRGWEL